VPLFDRFISIFAGGSGNKSLDKVNLPVPSLGNDEFLMARLPYDIVIE